MTSTALPRHMLDVWMVASTALPRYTLDVWVVASTALPRHVRNVEKSVTAYQRSGSGQAYLAPLLSSPMTAGLTHGPNPQRAERHRLVVLYDTGTACVSLLVILGWKVGATSFPHGFPSRSCPMMHPSDETRRFRTTSPVCLTQGVSLTIHVAGALCRHGDAQR